MKNKIAALLLSCCLTGQVQAQTDSNPIRTYRNFPIILTAQFHSLTLPFKDLKSNFANVGLGIGTEVSLNKKHNWVQQVNGVWYRNRTVGNGLLFYTQTAWRPKLSSVFYAEVKAGAGYMLAYRPVESYKPENGDWVSVGNKGKGLVTVPVGISVGYNKYSAHTYLSPFVSYQLLVLPNYNKSIPIIPETLLQAGVRIHYK
ncbi:hypothetical protein [Adhaeribacter radiodurans]|uniref:DUF3575 domain-containing protein n=1 Tax=Adhaeribacter radiodurans TaxID=2745197 RepID=A0A7L7LA55_9BACT|nr:hypothetical protein [Adhaeribacter radiodurans]QMU29617.1 hypothetical protein HUW48_16960 [Adhaeribacter radiodurans]